MSIGGERRLTVRRSPSSSRRIRSAPRARSRRASSAPIARGVGGRAGRPTRGSSRTRRGGRPARRASRRPSRQRGVTGDRRAAADAQARQQRALGRRRHLGGRIGERPAQLDDARVVGARLQRQRALPDRRQHAGRRPAVRRCAPRSPGDRGPPTRARAASTTPSATLRSRVSTLPRRISTRQIGARGAHLADAAQAGRPDAAARRQRAEPAPVAADDRVARIGARRQRRRWPGRRASSAGTSFMLCTATSISPRQQAFLDLLDPDALAAELDHRARLHAIALR